MAQTRISISLLDTEHEAYLSQLPQCSGVYIYISYIVAMLANLGPSCKSRTIKQGNQLNIVTIRRSDVSYCYTTSEIYISFALLLLMLKSPNYIDALKSPVDQASNIAIKLMDENIASTVSGTSFIRNDNNQDIQIDNDARKNKRTIDIDSNNINPQISPKFCENLFSKINFSSPVEVHTSIVSLEDGAKYPFWIQCHKANNNSNNKVSIQNNVSKAVTSSWNGQASQQLTSKFSGVSQETIDKTSAKKSDQIGSSTSSILDPKITSITDSMNNSPIESKPTSSTDGSTGINDQPQDETQDHSWVSYPASHSYSRAASCHNGSSEKEFQKTPPALYEFSDIRNEYISNITRVCENYFSKKCQSFKVGLLTQESIKCPTCGLGDLNCDTLHHCLSDCGHIKSVNYPLNYPNNHRCRWSIRAPENQYVNLSITDFDIPSSTNASKLGTCIFDYLTLIDGYTGKRLGGYCNENLPPPFIISPWNELIIQFNTNGETTGRGFYFQYEFKQLELKDDIKLQLETNSDKYSDACLPGWKYFKGHCYKAYFEHETLQWYDAEAKCNQHGKGLDGHLVSILNKDEMLAIHYMLTNIWKSPRYKDFYIGLIDVSREGFYRWSDNNPMSYTDWQIRPILMEEDLPAQPDGGAYEDCTVIKFNSLSQTSNWHDIPCSLGKHIHLRMNSYQSRLWDYVDSYICKTDCIPGSNPLRCGLHSVRRPLFSNEFIPSIQQPIASSTHLLSNSNNNLTVSMPATMSSNNKTANNVDLQQQSHKGTSLDDNRYFICDNLEVISVVLRCDGIANCRDGSDELRDCHHDCLDWQFKCANGRCISIGYYCDFVDDCGDGSDESHCERHRCKLNEFRCQNGQCIPLSQRCDLLTDCHDASDEGRLCNIGSNCNTNTTFQCYYGNCIPIYAVCDYQTDCPGKFREDEDRARCDQLMKSMQPVYNYQMASTNQRSNPAKTGYELQLPLSDNIEANSHLLNIITKKGGETAQLQEAPATVLAKVDLNMKIGGDVDESEYYDHQTMNRVYSEMIDDNQLVGAPCEPEKQEYFRCKSGHLIDNKFRCIYEYDQYSYQIGCRDVTHLIDCHDFECPPRDYVKCPDSYCIPRRYICDGKWDCIAGDDEVGCARYICPGQYKCANQSSCILLHQLCDGFRQCPMGDDEWFCDLLCPKRCDCIGQSVNCHNANLTNLPSNYISKSVRKLDLSYNSLGPNLLDTDFSAYHDLGELILHHNGIEVLIPRKFHQLRNLYKLDLSNNQIHSVKRGAFAGLRRVTQLLLESNPELVVLEPEAFLGLSSLQILNISSSRIHILKKNTFDGLTSLRHLLLRSNLINEIEDGAFRSLNSLVSLDMRGNDIRYFTKTVFSDLKSLRNLSTDAFKFCCLMSSQIPADRCLPLPDEISDCEDLMSSVLQRSCIWAIGIIACVGNCVVITWRYREYQKRNYYSRVNSTLLLSLGCSDLLMGIYLIIIAGVDVYYRGCYIENADNWRQSFLCNVSGFISTVSSEASVFTLVLIALNRCFELCKPLNFKYKFTMRWTHNLIMISWILSLIIAALPLVIKPYFRDEFYSRSGVCLSFHITNQKPAGWEYSIAIHLCANLVAFIIIVACYTAITFEIKRSRLSRQEQETVPVKVSSKNYLYVYFFG